MNRLTKLEIINETAEFYMADPSRRAFYKNGQGQPICEYNTEHAKKCAVGRCFTPRAIEMYGDYAGGIRDLVNKAIKDEFDDPEDIDDEEEMELVNGMLEPQYHGHALEFWAAIQNWHDHTGYWNNHTNQLSVMGQIQLDKLRTEYAGE